MNTYSRVTPHLVKPGAMPVPEDCELFRQEQPGQQDGLDHASLLLTEALNVANNAPDVRRDRVEAIRAQIESGEYEIDSAKLAEALIRENPDLFE